MPPTARSGAREPAIDRALTDADRLEDLRALVARQARDAHLAHDLEQALAERVDVVVHGLAPAEGTGRSSRSTRWPRTRGTGSPRRRRSRRAARRRPPRATSPVSTRRPARIRLPARASEWWTALVASRLGMGACVGVDAAIAQDEEARARRRRPARPPRTAPRARARATRPGPRRGASNSIGSTATGKSGSDAATSFASSSFVSTGCSSSSSRHWPGRLAPGGCPRRRGSSRASSPASRGWGRWADW